MITPVRIGALIVLAVALLVGAITLGGAFQVRATAVAPASRPLTPITQPTAASESAATVPVALQTSAKVASLQPGPVFAGQALWAVPSLPAEPASASSAPPVSGRVIDATRDGVVPIAASVSDGQTIVATDPDGAFAFEQTESPLLRVVAPGYWPTVVNAAADLAIVLEPIAVRAVYLPYEQLWVPESLDWALGLARSGDINALVVDIKEEGGATLPLVATDAVHALDAVIDPGSDVAAFLRELADLGIYRIARQVTFLDRRLALARPDAALRTRTGGIVDDGNYAWSDPVSEEARNYNLQIAEAAAPYFEEILFDYVRFPGSSSLEFASAPTPEARRAAIRSFAAEAADRLHNLGTAVSFATFGQTATVFFEDGIGQLLEDLAPLLDYIAPMVYPSTWPAGSFGFAYPAAHPGPVVLRSVTAAVERAASVGTARIRPWLQAFRDYGPRGLAYAGAEARAQIDASWEAGASGFMLWNPSLYYPLAALHESP